jgi:hypothetical protein
LSMFFFRCCCTCKNNRGIKLTRHILT